MLNNYKFNKIVNEIERLRILEEKEHEDLSKMKDFSFTRIFITDTENIEFNWNFDEQQADPEHHNFTIDDLKKELRALLKISELKKKR